MTTADQPDPHALALERMRREYRDQPLTEDTAGDDPLALLEHWLAQAVRANRGEWFEPNAITLATATPDGAPSARIVLLKGVDRQGLTFFTRYTSRKGRELTANPRAAAVLHWPELDRQVRAAGPVERLDPEASRRYFASRPRGSQLGAVASPQSRPIPDRAFLERRWADLDRQYAGQPVPMPEDWGGYLLRPNELEFWQGRPSRLHDRILFTRSPDGWHRQRLAP